MSSLTKIDKLYLETFLCMQDGYVLNYTDADFGEFFRHHKIDINGGKYDTYGVSKAKKMRAFWEQEPDAIVAPVLCEMLGSYEAYCDINGCHIDSRILKKCSAIVARLSGKPPAATSETVESFLDMELAISNIHKIPMEQRLAEIIEARLKEAGDAMRAGCHLSVIFLCGSVLEGVLFDVAKKSLEKFNRSTVSPKDKQGKVKPLREWNLAQLIDTAYDIKLLKLDVKKSAHGLRDFRNYIHPHEQMKSSGFTPDKHTAKICFEVLQAALASLAGERK